MRNACCHYVSYWMRVAVWRVAAGTRVISKYYDARDWPVRSGWNQALPLGTTHVGAGGGSERFREIEGDERQVMTPALHRSLFGRFVEVMLRQCDQVTDRWRDGARAGPAPPPPRAQTTSSAQRLTCVSQSRSERAAKYWRTTWACCSSSGDRTPLVWSAAATTLSGSSIARNGGGRRGRWDVRDGVTRGKGGRWRRRQRQVGR